MELNYEMFEFFIFGLVLGLGIFILLYLYIIVRTFNNNYRVKPKNIDVSDDQIINLILSKMDLYKEANLTEHAARVKTIGILNLNLIQEISELYYPNNKYSMYELSIDESIKVNEHIILRLQGILDKKIISKINKMRISSILNMINKNEDEEPKKKSLIGKITDFKPIKKVKNFIVNKGIKIALSYLCKNTIKIVGEEANKVYSKSLFLEEKIVSVSIEEDEESNGTI